MWTYLAYALFAAALAVVHAGLLTFGVSPFGLVNLWLLLAVSLVADFRLRHAVLVAVAGGLAADALSSLPPGTLAVAGVTAVLLAHLLLVRVFTQQSLAALIGMQAVVFVFFQLMLLAARAGRLVILGWSAVDSAVWPGFATLAAAVLAQAVAAAISMSLGRKLMGRFSALVLVVARRPRLIRP